MTALDHTTAPSPATWTADKVKARMVEAFDIDRRMPGERRKWQRSSWPATPVYSFRDQMHWNNPGDSARDRKWSEWENARNVAPAEVSRMEEAFEWLRWLPAGERRCFEAWAKAKVVGLPLRKVLKYRGWTVTTFYSRVDGGARRIAEKLNR
jgi:hypothetical protein